MKKLIVSALAFVTTVLIFTAVPAPAVPTLIIGSLSMLTNTTATSTPVPAFTYNQTLQQFSVTHGPLLTTNDFHFNICVNCRSDVTNGIVNIGTWYPSNTNACTETFSGSPYVCTNSLVIQTVVGTNGIAVGASYGQ